MLCHNTNPAVFLVGSGTVEQRNTGLKEEPVMGDKEMVWEDEMRWADEGEEWEEQEREEDGYREGDVFYSLLRLARWNIGIISGTCDFRNRKSLALSRRDIPFAVSITKITQNIDTPCPVTSLY